MFVEFAGHVYCYARVWRGFCALMTTMGLGLAALMWSPGMGLLAVTVSCTSAVVLLVLLRDLGGWPRTAAGSGGVVETLRLALWAGAGPVALCALTGSSPPIALLMVLLLVLTSPPVIHLVRREVAHGFGGNPAKPAPPGPPRSRRTRRPQRPRRLRWRSRRFAACGVGPSGSCRLSGPWTRSSVWSPYASGASTSSTAGTPRPCTPGWTRGPAPRVARNGSGTTSPRLRTPTRRREPRSHHHHLGSPHAAARDTDPGRQTKTAAVGAATVGARRGLRGPLRRPLAAPWDHAAGSSGAILASRIGISRARSSSSCPCSTPRCRTPPPRRRLGVVARTLRRRRTARRLALAASALLAC